MADIRLDKIVVTENYREDNLNGFGYVYIDGGHRNLRYRRLYLNRWRLPSYWMLAIGVA